MVIVFIGPPGSGKGTQANLLKEHLPNLIILTVSSLLLEKSSDGSIFGNQIKEKMDKGELIEDNIVNQVLTDKFTSLKGEDILIVYDFAKKSNPRVKKIFLKKKRQWNYANQLIN